MKVMKAENEKDEDWEYLVEEHDINDDDHDDHDYHSV